MRASAISSTDVLFADSGHGEKKRCFLVTFCHRTKSYPLLGAEALTLELKNQKPDCKLPPKRRATSKISAQRLQSGNHRHPSGFSPKYPRTESKSQKPRLPKHH